MFLTIMLSFTGYLLPWDRSPTGPSPSAPTWPTTRRSSTSPPSCCCWVASRWARTRSCGSRAPCDPAVPLAAAVFLAVHFWRIRKDGGISGPP
ncbi:MAG: hypothetical protein R3C32_05405 [Chloroflexota bacterium]